MTWIGSSGAFQGTVKDVLTGEGPRKVIFDIYQVQKGNYPYGNYTLEDSSIMHYDNENGQIQHYGHDYNFFSQYSMFALIIPVFILIMIVGVIMWRKRK